MNAGSVEQVALVSADGNVTALDSNALVVWLDETGHEELRDRNHPVFGLGGCATLGVDYASAVHRPWRRMKENHFGGPDVPLHAADLRPTLAQMEALADFFRTSNVHRFAAVVTDKTSLPPDEPRYRVVAEKLLEWIVKIAFPGGRQIAGSIVLVFERSQRGDALAKRYVPWAAGDALQNLLMGGRYRVWHWPIPVRATSLPKSGSAGLEVADFVIHTAGDQAKKPPDRFKTHPHKDFVAVFQEAGDLAEFACFREIRSL